MTRTVALETLGCKINQYESSYFLEELKKAGHRVVSFREPADVYIVHSCSVTVKAAFQSRQLLRRAQRLQPGATIVLAGCDAHVESDRIVSERLATHVIGNLEKPALTQWLDQPGSLAAPCCAVANPRTSRRLSPLPIGGMHTGRTRAFLKIQEGCDAFCTYCIVPFTRGTSRSLPLQEIRGQLDRFLDSGYREVVLTGIHLGQWGRDLGPALNLEWLLRSLGEGRMPARLRLSSLEPMEWTTGLMSVVADSPWICPHFHVPLQNGDPDVLRAMARPYSPSQYRDLVHELRYRFPEAAIGADVMVGFPGETEKQFQNCHDFIRDLPLTYLHVFPFSPRPGTAAASMPGRVMGPELKERSNALQRLSAIKRAAHESSFVGRPVELLVESEHQPGWWKGTSANYLKVEFPSRHQIQPGTILPVQVLEQTGQGLRGKALA